MVNLVAQIRWKQKLLLYIRKTGSLEKALVAIEALPWQVENVNRWLAEDATFAEATQHRIQAAWLSALRKTGSTEGACKLISTPDREVGIMEVFRWADNDKVFRNEWEKLVAKLEEGHRLRVKDLVEPAIRVKQVVLEKGLEGEADIDHLRLANQASDKVLAGTGYLVERQEQKIEGVIGIFNADDLAREYRAAKRRLAEGSDEPLDVPNGGSKDS